MEQRRRERIQAVFVFSALILVTGCSKDKTKVIGPDTDPPPVVAKTCRLTNYSTSEDLGGNGSQFAFSYDQDVNLNLVTATTLAGYPGVKVTIGMNGVKRDNGLSLESWSYGDVNIYKDDPPVGNREIVSSTPTPTKILENYKFDSKGRLNSVVMYDATTNEFASEIDFTYSDNDDCTSLTFSNGNTKALQIYYAPTYDGHPSGFASIHNRQFMHWFDDWESTSVKNIFDMMSAHNLTGWTHTEYDGSGAVSATYKSTFSYTYNSTSNMPETRTETAVVNNSTSTITDSYTYTGCE